MRDRSYASALLRLQEGHEPTVLAEAVAFASKPVLSTDGSAVFISRGTPGPDLGDRLRIDALTVEEVKVATGARRVLASLPGHLVFVIGQRASTLVVYVMDETGAHLDAIDLSTSTRTTLLTLPPYARDFTLDSATDTLVFTTASERTWAVQQYAFKRGQLRTLATGDSVALVPTVLEGKTLFAPRAGAGLVDTRSGTLAIPPQGPGFERVRAHVGALTLGLHERPSAFPQVWVLDGARERVPTASPSGALVDIAGVLE